eukprot:CAMPEP_0117680816 /NCGR_PEP_ID=MMETSP0804-20121206/18583_1 /TAXON_ID=1074897 /ORGANISM="Tetraselmis astigmatica, Strain CCMP880" /LENGTH=35 /DNA_ID= /DNA_START= /DNA_END= /DNA_ORIENTATION=
MTCSRHGTKVLKWTPTPILLAHAETAEPPKEARKE